MELAKGQLRLGEEDITPAVVTSESSAAKNTPTPMAIGRPKKKSRFDSTLFLKFSKPLHRKYLLTFRILCCLSLLILVWLDNVFVLYSYI